MTLRVLENFAGIGTQRMALENLGIEHEVVGITEIDKFAIKSYEAVHGEVNNLGDISLVDPNDVPDHDLFTYSFPCQDISVAGKGKGFEKGAGTRSGLLWECEKVIRVKKPKYLLMENVKNLVSKKFLPGFEEWLTALEELGYTNYWQVLNAKDFGIPQNRERVFCVSILGEHEPYEFPEKETLELRLKDILEHEVDEKFYLDNDKAKQLIATVSEKYDINETTPTDGGLKEPKPKEVANTILARYDAGISNQQSTGTMVIEPKAERIGGIFDKEGERHQAGAVWDKEQLAPTLDTMQGGWRQPSVFIKNNTKQGYVEATDGDGVDLAFPSSNTRRGRVQKDLAQTLDTSDSKGVVVADDSKGVIIGSTQKNAAINTDGIVPTLTSAMGLGGGHVPMHNYETEQVVSKEEFGRMGRQAVETLNENDVKHSDTINPFNKRVSSDDGISPTLTTRPEGFKTAVLPVVELEKIKRFINDNYKDNGSVTDLPKVFQAVGDRGNHSYSVKDISNTIPANAMSDRGQQLIEPSLRIRKLTPKECWRLMGISDDDFEKAQEVNSNTQLYKQAGNAIVVDVLEAIFTNMFK